MLTHRLQVLVDPEQHRRLEDEARARGVSVGALVRTAIDSVAPDRLEERRRAFDELMALEPFPVPDDPDDLERELDTMWRDPAIDG